MFSWRGSTGASGYDIERAPTPAGPWTLIATNVSDADVAYRPLYSDTTARPGETWWYRVTGHNASGRSPASNVVGPVRVREICLVDEFQTLDRSVARSSRLRVANEYNALYAEYLFRAAGTTNDFVLYETPGAVTRVRMTAFCDGDPALPAVEASAEGTAWRVVPIAWTERRLPSPPGGAAGRQRRTQADGEGSPPAGCRRIRIRWTGPMELDRVEIYWSGGGR